MRMVIFQHSGRGDFWVNPERVVAVTVNRGYSGSEESDVTRILFSHQEYDYLETTESARQVVLKLTSTTNEWIELDEADNDALEDIRDD